MLSTKKRILSIFRPPAIVAAAGLATMSTTIHADPAYQHVIDQQQNHVNVIDLGYLDSPDRIWLELDAFASEISMSNEPSNDVLVILRNGFSLDPVMNNRVQAELKWFVRNPNYLNRVFNRAQRGFIE